MTPLSPTPIEPHETLLLDVEVHLDAYRHYRDAGDAKKAEKAFTRAQIAYEALGDELDRLADKRAEVEAA